MQPWLLFLLLYSCSVTLQCPPHVCMHSHPAPCTVGEASHPEGIPLGSPWAVSEHRGESRGRGKTTQRPVGAIWESNQYCSERHTSCWVSWGLKKPSSSPQFSGKQSSPISPDAHLLGLSGILAPVFSLERQTHLGLRT